MTYNFMLKKLFSRKLWLAIAGVAVGIAVSLGVDSSEITTITGAVTALISAVTYIVVEGKIDAESVKTAVESTQEAVNTIERVDSDSK